jgi:hypothetical protein
MAKLIAGKELILGGETFIAPPVPMACVRKYKDLFSGKEKGADMLVMADIVLMSLQRNYPEMTESKLDELLDLANLPDAFNLVMGNSGTENQSGEAPAASQ